MSSELLAALIAEVKALKERVAYLTSKETDRRASSGTPIYSGLTAGRVLFVGFSKELDDDSALFWDDSSKRLAVGVISPAAPLHLYSTTASEIIRVEANNASLYPGVHLKSNTRKWQMATGSSGTGSLAGVWYVYDETAAQTRLAITPAGNVGIGTDAPTAKLDVTNGYIRAREGTNTSPTSGTGIELVYPTGDRGYIQAYDRSGSAWRPLVFNASTFLFSPDGIGRFSIQTLNNRVIALRGSSSGSEPSYIAHYDSTGASERWVEGVEHGVAKYIWYTPALGYIGNWSYSNGYLRVGDSTTAGYRLELPNTATAAGQGRANAWVTYSSRSFKKNIKTPERGAYKNKIKRLRTVEYDVELPRKDDEPAKAAKDISLIAEEVLEVWPELVTGDPTRPETLGLKLDRIGVALLPAVQEHDERIAVLEAKVDRLEQELEALRRVVERQQRTLDDLEARARR